MTASIWLLKTEPDEFSIDDLAQRGVQGEPWSGIRNFQARNYLRQMKMGDIALIYHSGCAQPAIVGQAMVIHEAYPDAEALNPSSDYFDAKSSSDNIRWSIVDVRFSHLFNTPVTLKQIKLDERLASMALLKQSRLSVSPVTEKEYRVLSTLAE